MHAGLRDNERWQWGSNVLCLLGISLTRRLRTTWQHHSQKYIVLSSISCKLACPPACVFRIPPYRHFATPPGTYTRLKETSVPPSGVCSLNLTLSYQTPYTHLGTRDADKHRDYLNPSNLATIRSTPTLNSIQQQRLLVRARREQSIAGENKELSVQMRAARPARLHGSPRLGPHLAPPCAVLRRNAVLPRGLPRGTAPPRCPRVFLQIRSVQS